VLFENMKTILCRRCPGLDEFTDSSWSVVNRHAYFDVGLSLEEIEITKDEAFFVRMVTGNPWRRSNSALTGEADLDSAGCQPSHTELMKTRPCVFASLPSRECPGVYLTSRKPPSPHRM